MSTTPTRAPAQSDQIRVRIEHLEKTVLRQYGEIANLKVEIKGKHVSVQKLQNDIADINANLSERTTNLEKTVTALLFPKREHRWWRFWA